VTSPNTLCPTLINSSMDAVDSVKLTVIIIRAVNIPLTLMRSDCPIKNVSDQLIKENCRLVIIKLTCVHIQVCVIYCRGIARV